MNTQINIRLPDKLLAEAKTYAEKNGFGSLQDFIKETLREKLFDEPKINKEELLLVNKLLAVAESKNLYGTEKDLLDKIRRKKA